MPNHLFALMRDRMPADDRTFIETPAVEESGSPSRVMTYGDAVALSSRMANLLIRRGVQPGDRVAVQLERARRPSSCISPACAPAPSICRSTPPIP